MSLANLYKVIAYSGQKKTHFGKISDLAFIKLC